MTTVPFTDEEIMHGVRQDVADCTGFDVDEVTPKSSFFTDLDGESIDVIDLTFRCEKRFGAKIPFQGMLSGLQVDPAGRISQTSLGELTARIPAIDWTAHVGSINSNDPRDLLTVDLIVQLVKHSISENTTE